MKGTMAMTKALSREIVLSHPSGGVKLGCENCPSKNSCKSTNNALLAEDAYFKIGGIYVAVKKGFCYDGASIPRAVWSLVGHPFQHDILAAGTIHDGLYACQAFGLGLNRKECDQVLKDVVSQFGTNAKAATMYQAVNLFGGSAWKCTEEEKQHFAKFLVRVDEKDVPSELLVAA